jgi:hypothetical protein
MIRRVVQAERSDRPRASLRSLPPRLPCCEAWAAARLDSQLMTVVRKSRKIVRGTAVDRNTFHNWTCKPK